MAGTFKKIVKGAALMTGTRAEIQASTAPYRARRPNMVLNEAYVEYAEQVGLNPKISSKPGRGSSDFGDVSQKVPGVHVYFGISESRQIAAHSKEMLEAAAGDYGLQQMTRTSEALANMGYRFFKDKKFMQGVVEEFRKGKR